MEYQYAGHQDDGQDDPHIQRIVRDGDNGLFGERYKSQKTGYCDSAGEAGHCLQDIGLTVYKIYCKNNKKRMKRQARRQGDSRRGSGKSRCMEQYASPCGEQKQPQGNGCFIKNAEKQADSGVCAQQKAGAERDPEDFRCRAVKFRQIPKRLNGPKD